MPQSVVERSRHSGAGERELPARPRRRLVGSTDGLGRYGIAAVGSIVVVLLVVAVIGSVTTEHAAERTQRAVRLNTAYRKVATGVAAEESLERKYRLEPGPVPLAAHRAARVSVLQGLADVGRLGDASDEAISSHLGTEHVGYVTAVTIMFAAVDRHESSTTVNAIDSKSVDPVFGAMQSETYAAAAIHETQALIAVGDTRRTGRVVFVLDVLILVAAVALIATAVVALTRSRDRLVQQSDINRHQALHDSLTGLPNRALFRDRAALALRAARRSGDRIAVMVVDIDRFKDVNDTLGHQYGDLLLEQIALRFESTLRAGDSVARLGGDEFAVLLCSSTDAAALAAAQRLTDVLHESFTIKDISLDVEASIGIAVATADSDIDAVLRHADIAMYEAKGQHASSAIYERSRDDNTVARLALLGDLRRAIARHELSLQYQPKVDTETGAVHSVEALVRWHHPTRGLLMPDVFIPIAEGTAVIHPLTDEILRQALVQVRTWRADGWRFPVFVNISARSLHDLAFPDRVQALLETIGLPPSALSLELTEGSIMTDPERALAALHTLDGLGVSLSIDDFGTGYSSMSYLKDLPVRELKIDRSFVIGMSRNGGDAVLVQSAVDLGHNLGLHVVAEGVEDAATRDALTAMGCDLLQGYFIHRPADAIDLDRWLLTQTRTHYEAVAPIAPV
jgi:diguanylate cyclase (GGDEF)-like protein